MDRSQFEESLSPVARQQIAARCEEYQCAWLAGKSPRLDDHLRGVPKSAQRHMLRSMLRVALDKGHDHAGQRLSDETILAAYPSLQSEIREALAELHAAATKREGANLPTVQLLPSHVEGARTIEHTPSRKDSRGLHIRCPHCSNRVELITDTPYEEVSCAACGSRFSLVNRNESTQMTTPLKTIDRFDLVARLGVGGFGTVWKARDRELDRVVAVKIPRRGQLSSAEIEQFFREARSAAQLRHPHIVPVHEVGRDGETLFIVTDLIRGVTLSDWLTAHRPGAGEVAELCVTITDALAHAHGQGIVHRDLKPSNIMIDEMGEPHLMDFGLAKREIGEITMTVDGQILGTPAYMSPEQAGGAGHWTDRRSDIYSLGVVLFELMTGELPFRGNPQMQIHQRLTEDAPDPRKLNSHIPRDMATICLKCLEREPGRRYATAGELGAEFKHFLRGEPIQARPLSRPARLARWAKRKPMIATTAALILFLAIAGPLAALGFERQRSRLVELVAEKNHLIDRYAADTQQSAHEISMLRGELDLWEGRANPWEFWPPKRNEPPRQMVLADLLRHLQQSLSSPLEKGQYTGEEEVRGQLAMAIMADAAGQKADAFEHYQAAREQLMAFRRRSADQPHISLALAECDADLARLVADENRARATEYSQHARSILAQLASEHRRDASYQIAWLESELNCATLTGFKAAEKHLNRVAQIARSLPAMWPGDPTDVYRLTCYVAQRDPVFLPVGNLAVP
jgi:serine/threonine protein kinase/ribosomal protein S27E